MVGIKKRPREEHEEGEREMAKLLMLLAGDGEDNEGSKAPSTPPSTPPSPAAAGRVFECKSCNRQFATFQALGGHRASHKKTRGAGERDAGGGKPKVHECSVCGLEFAVGQALGGHMRRHRAAAPPPESPAAEEGGRKKRVMWLDLNLTPLENDLVMRRIVGIGDWAPIIGCHH